jgi:hypothetical protein
LFREFFAAFVSVFFETKRNAFEIDDLESKAGALANSPPPQQL